MKKLLILVVIAIVAYLVYDNFIKVKEVVKINATYIKARQGGSIDVPNIAPSDYAHYEGTVKNISGKTISNLIIIYLIDGQESEYKIGSLAPGQEINFKSEMVMLHHVDAEHYLKSIDYDKESLGNSTY